MKFGSRSVVLLWSCLVIVAAGGFILQFRSKRNGAPPPGPEGRPHVPRSGPDLRAPRPPMLPSDGGVQPSGPTSRQIRVRQPDGSFALVDETEDMLRERIRRRKEAEQKFERARQAVQAGFLRTLAGNGHGAAYAELRPFLRTPEDGLEGRARVAEALRLCFHILKSNPQEEPTLEGFRPLHPAILEDLRALLTGTGASSLVQEIAIGYAAGFDMTFSFAGDAAIFREGVWTFDPLAPIVAAIQVKAHADGTHTPADPALLALFSPLLRNPECSPYVRSALLVALDVRSLPGEDPIPLGRLAASDGSPRVRQAAIGVLGRHLELLQPGEALAILSAQTDAATAEAAFKALGMAASRDPGFSNVLIAFLTAPPDGGSQDFEVALLRAAAVRTGIAAYQASKDSRLLGILTERLGGWARERSSQELVAILASEAARLQIRELEPSLRSVAPLIEEADSRAQVEEAIQALAR